MPVLAWTFPRAGLSGATASASVPSAPGRGPGAVRRGVGTGVHVPQQLNGRAGGHQIGLRAPRSAAERNRIDVDPRARQKIMLQVQPVLHSPLPVFRREQQRQRAGVQVVADFQNQPGRFGERRRSELRHARELGDVVAGGKRGVGVVGQRRGIDRDSRPAQRLDEQAPSETRRVGDFIHPHKRPMAQRDRSRQNEAVPGSPAKRRDERAAAETVSTRASTGTSAVCGRQTTVGRLSQFAGGDRQVDQVVVDDDGRQPARAAAGARFLLEEPVVNQDFAADALDPRLGDLAGEGVEAGQRIGLGQLPLFAAVGVRMVVVGEGDSSVGGRPATEREVAAGDEDQVAFQLAGRRPRPRGGRPASRSDSRRPGRRGPRPSRRVS